MKRVTVSLHAGQIELIDLWRNLVPEPEDRLSRSASVRHALDVFLEAGILGGVIERNADALAVIKDRLAWRRGEWSEELIDRIDSLYGGDDV